MRNIISTERLYYKDSINRMLRQKSVLKLKELEEKEIISNMKPKLSKGTEQIIRQKREGIYAHQRFNDIGAYTYRGDDQSTNAHSFP